MSIQEISLSNSQKKKLLRIESLDGMLFQDDNGELVVNIVAYQSFKNMSGEAPIESVIGDNLLDFEAEYFVFH